MEVQTFPRIVNQLRSHSLPAKLFSSQILPEIEQLRPIPNPAKSGAFTSSLAHEVRNPLSNINLAAEMLKSSVLDADQQIYLDIITRASTRINDLVTDLLTVGQSAGITGITSTSIHQLLDEVLFMTKDRILLKNILISKNYSFRDCKIQGDKEKIKMALTNIIINAIDAMTAGKGRLQLITRSINGKCILEIKDNGIGIQKENLKKIFQPYFTNKPGGMGLGLSTTLEILKSNQITVDVLSEEGTGTRFMLSFDMAQQPGKE
ncbi:two-component system sensor histidine kinase NtrB [Flavitalea flava]